MAKAKVAPENKVSFFNKMRAFFSAIISELKKVHWPNRKQMMIYTGVVFFAVVFSAGLIWVFDLGISWVLELVTNALT
jgi:preprotein translocase subunit SecE